MAADPEDEDGDLGDGEGDGEAGAAFHQLPEDVPRGGSFPIVCVAMDTADSLCNALGVSREKRPAVMFPILCRQLLVERGFPLGLVTKALEKHPRSFIKAQQWLESHRDLLMEQHDLLTGLSADVAAPRGWAEYECSGSDVRKRPLGPVQAGG